MRVLVTGGQGFLGKHIQNALAAKNHSPCSFRSHQFDLRHRDAAFYMLNVMRPEVVVHAAAHVGGIEYNRRHGERLMRDNLHMGINIIEACRQYEVKKLILIGSVCMYPDFLGDMPTPYSENWIWDGYPEKSNAGYGLAKRMVMEMGIQAHDDRLQVVNLVLANLYGPGDTLHHIRSHVVPGVILKLHEANQQGSPTVTCWGTGEPTRDLLYAEDAADAAVKAIEWENPTPEPINIASGMGTKVAFIAERLADLMEFRGKITWDESFPDGQMVREFDITRAASRLKWMPKTTLWDGLDKTVQWAKSALKSQSPCPPATPASA